MKFGVGSRNGKDSYKESRAKEEAKKMLEKALKKVLKKEGLSKSYNYFGWCFQFHFNGF